MESEERMESQVLKITSIKKYKKYKKYKSNIFCFAGRIQLSVHNTATELVTDDFRHLQ